MTESDIEHVAERAAPVASDPDHGRVVYLGSLLFSGDDLVLCLFKGPSRPAMKHASENAGIRCERLMDTEWLTPDPRIAKGASSS